MREIVTLQLGNLSNYVGTHFWNAQESYFTYGDQDASPVDHNIHWRAGLGADGSDTFLPRTVIYDLKGGFGSLRRINPLYDNTPEDAASGSLWSGTPQLQKQPALERSSYQQSLDAGLQPNRLSSSDIRYWSDFSRVYYHPKSLVQLYDYELHSPTVPFDRFASGSELFSNLNRDHDIVDRDWRPFVEECDRMQGIQVFSSMDDGWGGFAAEYLEALRDEYPKTTIWVWGLQTPFLDTPRAKRQVRLANTAQSLHRFCTHASMVAPLAVPEDSLPSDIALDRSSTWDVSAFLSTAAESAVLQSRLHSTSDGQVTSLGDLAERLNASGNQTLAKTQLSVGPATAVPGCDDAALAVDLFQIGHVKGQRNKPGQLFGKILSSRGIVPADEDEGNQENLSNGRRVIGNPLISKYSTSLKFPLLDSFPRIYRSVTPESGTDLQTILATDKSVATGVKSLKSQAAWSIGVDERENLVNGLSEIADAYVDDWSSGSDEDDDDS